MFHSIPPRPYQGVLIYEMVFGWPPFYHEDPMKVYAKIISGKISYPDTFSNPLEDIIAKLCTKNPSKRLGNMKGGIADLVKHKWFGPFDWKGLRKGTIPAPFVPEISAKCTGAEDDGEDELVVSRALTLMSFLPKTFHIFFFFTPHHLPFFVSNNFAGGERLDHGLGVRFLINKIISIFLPSLRAEVIII